MVDQVLLTCANAPCAPITLWLLVKLVTTSALRSLVSLNSKNDSALPDADSFEYLASF